MAAEHPLRDLLHGATHRIPGVPAHVEHPAGHQGPANQDRANQGPANAGPANRGHAQREGARHPHPGHRAAAPEPSPRSSRQPRDRSWNHSPARPPRVLAAWQRRVARFFGQEV
jgi:hypothetical protein